MTEGTYSDKDNRVVRIFRLEGGGYMLRYKDNGQTTVIR